MRIIFKKLATLVLLCFVMSSFSCALYYYQVIRNTDSAYSILLLAATVIFIGYNIYIWRRCYVKLHCNKRQYYLFNYAAYGIFMLITALAYLLLGEVPYAWMFNTLKLLAFTKFDLSTVCATAVTHFVMLGVIAVVPFLPKAKIRRGRRRV